MRPTAPERERQRSEPVAYNGTSLGEKIGAISVCLRRTPTSKVNTAGKTVLERLEGHKSRALNISSLGRDE